MDREEYKVRQFARNYSAGDGLLGSYVRTSKGRTRRRGLTMEQHTLYVVVNSAGEYFRWVNPGINWYEWGEVYDAHLYLTRSYAEHRADLVGGTVKRVTITIEED